jgi:two-component system LytT family response regulator
MTAVIVEDEVLAAENLKNVLKELGSYEEILILESIRETVEFFRNHGNPDILFLDIHLADGMAFEIFNKINVDCPIIFVTAYDEYALKAFQVNSIDYLLKPVDIFDVKRALDKLKRLSKYGASVDQEIKSLISFFRKSSNFKSNFLIPVKGDKLIPLKTEDIAYFYIDHGVVRVYPVNGRSYSMDKTLDELEEMLDPEMFFRANRQFIISRRSIKDIDFWFSNRLSVNLKIQAPEKIIISKARISEFKQWFGT